MYTIINAETKQYLRNDWDQYKGQIYTHNIDLAVRFASWHEAEEFKEGSELICEL
ncbi:hypothetical protein D3C74_489300 [compost metagenome]